MTKTEQKSGIKTGACSSKSVNTIHYVIKRKSLTSMGLSIFTCKTGIISYIIYIKGC